MAMRRAAFLTDNPADSPKRTRLCEIVDEATDNNRKVIVYSYFRDVLHRVHAALGPRALGPLTGSVTGPRRQELVDQFSTRREPAVLVSQIEAGGIGLSIQAASVVIIAEPQWKPATEEQAIARCHRMGQIRPVEVHRLLTENSVDEHMLAVIEASGASPAAKLCLRFVILTACCSGEARGARLSEIDFDARQWRIPGEPMKAGADHRGPLSDTALAVLEDARTLEDGSDIVFPSPAKPGQPLSDVALITMLRDNGLAAWTTVHGFRSAFKSWTLEATDTPWAVAEMALAKPSATPSNRPTSGPTSSSGEPNPCKLGSVRHRKRLTGTATGTTLHVATHREEARCT